MKWLRTLWLNIQYWWTGRILNARLKDHGSPQRSDAELAVELVVARTSLAPDCVVATVLNGGPAILVRHDKATEAFVNGTYLQNAEAAIEWVNRNKLRQGNVSNMNRAQRRQFDKLRKREQ